MVVLMYTHVYVSSNDHAKVKYIWTLNDSWW